MKSLTTGAVIDFIEKIFDKENILYNGISNQLIWASNSAHDVIITITDYDMPNKSDTEELLDKCVLLNTYLSGYFSVCGYISKYDIFYRGDYFEEKFDLFGSQPIKGPGTVCSYRNSLFINELVRINTEAEKKVDKNWSSEYTEYNYIFTKLKENLIKEANG